MATLQHLSARVNAADPPPVRPKPRPRKPKPVVFAPVSIDDVAEGLVKALGRIDGTGEYALFVVRQGVPDYGYVSSFDPDPTSTEAPTGLRCPTCGGELWHVGPGRFTCPGCAVRPGTGPDDVTLACNAPDRTAGRKAVRS